MGSGDLQGCGRVALECWEGLGQEERWLQGRWTGECGAESSPILKIPIVGNCSKISGGRQFGRNTKRSLLSDTAEILSGAFGSGALFYRGTVAVFYQGLCPTAFHVSSSGTRVFLKKEVQCQHIQHPPCPLLLGFPWLWALGLQPLCCRQWVWKANPRCGSNLCPSEPLGRIQVHHVGLQDGEMIGAICPQNVPFLAGCPCSGDVAAAAPGCLSHSVLGISLHGGLASVLFPRLPAQSERSCPISFLGRTQRPLFITYVLACHGASLCTCQCISDMLTFFQFWHVL